MKKRNLQVAAASFAITLLLIGGLWGLLSVDVHSRRYGVGEASPAVTARLDETFFLQMSILGHQRTVSIDAVNQIQRVVQQQYAFVPRALRLASALRAEGRMAYERHQEVLRELQFREHLLADGF